METGKCMRYEAPFLQLVGQGSEVIQGALFLSGENGTAATRHEPSLLTTMMEEG